MSVFPEGLCQDSKFPKGDILFAHDLPFSAFPPSRQFIPADIHIQVNEYSLEYECSVGSWTFLHPLVLHPWTILQSFAPLQVLKDPYPFLK